MLKHAFCQQQQKQNAVELWLINHLLEVERLAEKYDARQLLQLFLHQGGKNGE